MESDKEYYTLMHGDCLKELDRVEDYSVDMVLCDPPYGCTSRNEWDVPIDYDQLFAIFDRVCKPNAAVVMFSQGMHTAKLMTGPWKSHWRYNLIWKKNKPRGFLNSKNQPLRYHEDIVVFYKNPPVYNPQMIEVGLPIHACKRKKTSVNYGEGDGGVNTRAGKTTRYPGSVLEFPVVNSEEKPIHPTQKPISLCEFLIRSFSKEGDLVLDPCCGSSSTGVACVRNNRIFYGIEKQEDFYNASVIRLQQEL